MKEHLPDVRGWQDAASCDRVQPNVVTHAVLGEGEDHVPGRVDSLSLRRWILQHLVSGGTVIHELDDAYDDDDDDDDNDWSFLWWESRRAGLKPAWPTNLEAPDAGSSSGCSFFSFFEKRHLGRGLLGGQNRRGAVAALSPMARIRRRICSAYLTIL